MTGIVSSRLHLGVLIYNPCLRVESGNYKLNNTDVTGYRNASSRFITSPPEAFFKKRCSLTFRKIHRKKPVPESLFFNKAAG